MVVIGLFILAAVIAVGLAVKLGSKGMPGKKYDRNKPDYNYIRKDNIMTPYEVEFFKRLEHIYSNRYYVFPQIHLSSLLINKTTGRYHKAGYQRLRRYAVDYALVDKQTMVTKYAIELDDSTHDTRNRKIRDKGLEADLEHAGVKLVRFRGVKHLSDNDISSKLVETNNS